MTTKKSLIGLFANAAQIRATVVGGKCEEDWPATVAEIKAKYSDAVEHDNGIQFAKNGGQVQFMIKPKITRKRTGTMKFNSSNYEFLWDGKSSPGNIKDLKVGENQTLELDMLTGGKMVYSIVA